MYLSQVVEQLPEIDKVLSPEFFKPVGQWHEVEIPDTLDLADRAELAVNGLIGNMKPDQHYAGTQTFRFDTLGPYDDHPNWAMPIKFLRSLPLMRTMCGSEEYLDVECAAMKAVLKQISKDGQLYFPIAEDGPPAGTSYPTVGGLMVLALLQWYARDDNPVWLEWAKVLCEGLKQSIIQVEDYGYIPPEWSLGPDGKWHWTLRGPGTFAKKPEEPIFDQEGYEGSVKFDQAGPVRAMVWSYKLFGDVSALEFARKLVRFCLKPKMWEDTKDDELAPGHEHGIWAGHVHGNLASLQALLIFAMTTGDERLKQICREGYEHGRRHGVIRLGFVPGWLKPTKFGRSVVHAESNEGCAIADMLMLATMLTDAGLGDYWDDVDSIIRNHLIELQITDLELIKKVTGAGSEHDKTFKRIVGGFGEARLTSSNQSMTNACCVGNATRSLYYAWEGITRFDKGVATVNLFLNRVSTWMDVVSYLPYQGKVLLYNKEAHTCLIRIPYWVDIGKLTCFLNDRAITPSQAGNYLIVENLKARDIIRLEFPVLETIETYTICGTKYTAKFRGSTVVDITPRDTDTEEHKNKYPFFKRDHLKSTVAPMRKVKRFVAQKLLSTF